MIAELIAVTFAAAEKERKRETTGRRKRERTYKIHIQTENTLKMEHL